MTLCIMYNICTLDKKSVEVTTTVRTSKSDQNGVKESMNASM